MSNVLFAFGIALALGFIIGRRSVESEALHQTISLLNKALAERKALLDSHTYLQMRTYLNTLGEIEEWNNEHHHVLDPFLYSEGVKNMLAASEVVLHSINKEEE